MSLTETHRGGAESGTVVVGNGIETPTVGRFFLCRRSMTFTLSSIVPPVRRRESDERTKQTPLGATARPPSRGGGGGWTPTDSSSKVTRFSLNIPGRFDILKPSVNHTGDDLAPPEGHRVISIVIWGYCFTFCRNKRINQITDRHPHL